jgi:hypothetical protein
METSVQAKSTIKSAFSNPLNLYILLGCISGFGVTTFLFFEDSSPPLFRWIMLALFLLIGWFTVYYIRAILNRELEISSVGIRYREASTHLFFAWHEIQKVKIEPTAKQITIWKGNKRRHIHELGLPKDELALVHQALQKALLSNNIPIVGPKVIEKPTQTPLEKAESAIQTAWLIAFAVTIVTLVVQLNRGTSAGPGFDILLIEFTVGSLLAYGIYRKSRIASVLMLAYYIAGKLIIVLQTGNSMVLTLSFLPVYFLFQGMMGTFSYHRLRKSPPSSQQI